MVSDAYLISVLSEEKAIRFQLSQAAVDDTLGFFVSEARVRP